MKKLALYTLALSMGAIGAMNAYDYKSDYRHREAGGGIPADVAAYLADSVKDRETLDAMTFLYAYMPSTDVGGYSPQFFKSNVESTLRSRKETAWGMKVPEREWLHFVLPLRVNNEALDMSRLRFYDELKERVAGMSMPEAILEVNHWCHEKVTYRPSDARTSSPLSTVSQAIGRCGEESTFTVAALRAVGIPARQVYTPRWAHTDDNHAWVEAWADGKWYFLGACEPEPVLNLAWFNAPAARGMLMHTNVFGVYDGPEEVIDRFNTTTTINVTANYAPVDTLTVKVEDISGKAVADAVVEFCIYNYSEFYPAAVKRSDVSGVASIAAGRGDLVVRASDGKGNYGISVMNTSESREKPRVITLDKDSCYTGRLVFDIVPPKAGGTTPDVSEEARENNRRRLAYEDSLRKGYEAGFASSEDAEKLSDKLGLDKEGRAILNRTLPLSRGNWRMIASFLSQLDKNQYSKALGLLNALCEKDLRDIPEEVLYDVVRYTTDRDAVKCSEDDYMSYIICPRVELERLVPYREYFSSAFTKDERERYKSDPKLLAERVAREFDDDSAWNPHGYRADAISTDKVGTASPLSKGIYFVSAARSCGIPSRIDVVTGKTQYKVAGEDWKDVSFNVNVGDKTHQTGSLRLSYNPSATLPDPIYYNHFSISRIEKDKVRQLEYDQSPYSQLFSGDVTLDAGEYMLVSGQRMADGSLLGIADFFIITPGETTELPLEFRHDDSRPSVIGNLNAENIYIDSATGQEKSILSSTGRGYYVLAIVRPGHEPTEHLLNELEPIRADFAKAGTPVVVLSEPGDATVAAGDRRLPSGAFIGVDKDGKSLKELISSLHLPENDLPVVVVADTFNRVVHVSHGYSIGAAGRLLKCISQVQSATP